MSPSPQPLLQARSQTLFDGDAPPRRVDLKLGDTLQIFAGGRFLAAWALADIRRAPAPAGPLRIRSLTAAPKAWCEISDPLMAAAIAQRCRLLDGDAQEKREARWRTPALAAVAVAVIAGFVWFVVPAIADRLAPLVPDGVEKQIGAAADSQARARFRGDLCTAPAGEAALRRLVDRLKVASGVALDVNVSVLSSPVQNAFALPGGRVYLLRGLIETAQSPDEVAGVLAHEFGHVAHRDSLRAALRQGGSALAIGIATGGAFGAGAISAAARASLSAAYSREAERDADDFAVALMARAGRPTRALGDVLERIARDETPSPLDFLRDHPLTRDRMSRLDASPAGAPGEPLITEGEWTALRAICSR